MSEERIGSTPPPRISSDVSRSQRSVQSQEAGEIRLAQEVSQIEFSAWADQAFNPLAMARRSRFEPLENKAKRKGKEEEAEKAQKERQILEVQRLEEVSEQFQRKNPELLPRSLLLLRARISSRDSKEDILKKVLEAYPDYSLADEALDFLLETSDGDLSLLVRQAKDDLNALYGREVRAGRNIHSQAREFSSQGLGTPTALRDMYRDITGNPRDPSSLFSELTATFSYEKMKVVIDFLLHSLGSDLKSKGPSISRAELHRLVTDARTLQAILGVYRFFNSRMNLINSAFARQGLSLPVRLNFELLAKQFMKYLQERYPSMDKILQLAIQMGISEEIAAQIIIYMQMRDAVRQVAPKLFKSEQHRQDVLSSLIETLEELEERIEEEEEKKEEKEKKGKEKEEEQ